MQLAERLEPIPIRLGQPLTCIAIATTHRRHNTLSMHLLSSRFGSRLDVLLLVSNSTAVRCRLAVHAIIQWLAVCAMKRLRTPVSSTLKAKEVKAVMLQNEQ